MTDNRSPQTPKRKKHEATGPVPTPGRAAGHTKIDREDQKNNAEKELEQQQIRKRELTDRLSSLEAMLKELIQLRESIHKVQEDGVIAEIADALDLPENPEELEKLKGSSSITGMIFRDAHLISAAMAQTGIPEMPRQGTLISEDDEESLRDHMRVIKRDLAIIDRNLMSLSAIISRLEKEAKFATAFFKRYDKQIYGQVRNHDAPLEDTSFRGR